MLSALLARLNNNTWIIANIKVITGAYGNDYPFIRYIYTPLTSDGVKAQARLDLTAVSPSIATSLDTITECNKSLITIGDLPVDDNILEIRLNGGGSLYNEDTKTFHVKAIYTILYKERG